MDPEGNEVTMGRGAGGGDRACPVGSQISSCSATVEEKGRPWGNEEDNPTCSMQHLELIMHRVYNIVKQ